MQTSNKSGTSSDPESESKRSQWGIYAFNDQIYSKKYKQYISLFGWFLNVLVNN